PGPAALRGGYVGEAPPAPYPAGAPYPPPPPGAPYPNAVPISAPGVDMARYERLSAARAFYQLQLALHRGDPAWTALYDRTAAQADSGFGIGTEWHEMAGNKLLNSFAKGRVAIGNGIALIGQVDYTL